MGAVKQERCKQGGRHTPSGKAWHTHREGRRHEKYDYDHEWQKCSKCNKDVVVEVTRTLKKG